jgi:hypothetical protein
MSRIGMASGYHSLSMSIKFPYLGGILINAESDANLDASWFFRMPSLPLKVGIPLSMDNPAPHKNTIFLTHSPIFLFWLWCIQSQMSFVVTKKNFNWKINNLVLFSL